MWPRDWSSDVCSSDLDCVALKGDHSCKCSREDGLEPDPQAMAAEEANLPVLDLTDEIGRASCRDGVRRSEGHGAGNNTTISAEHVEAAWATARDGDNR